MTDATAPRRPRRSPPPARYPDTLSLMVERGFGDRCHLAAESAGVSRNEWIRRTLTRALKRLERERDR